MAKVIYSPSAEVDLTETAAFIAADSPEAALQWLEKIHSVCKLLASHAELGQKVRTKRLREVRRHVVGAYLIYYRPIPDGVEIANVIHGARDQDKLV